MTVVRFPKFNYFRTPVGIVAQTVFKMGDSTILFTRSQEHWACYNNHDRLNARSLLRSGQNVIAGAIRKPTIAIKRETLYPR